MSYPEARFGRLPALVLTLACLAIVGCRAPAPSAGSEGSGDDGDDSRFRIHRGTNISHWLSQSDRRGEERRQWFTRDDVEYLAGLGFDHLRIPVDEEQLWDEQGQPIEEAFGLLESGLDWCAELGLRVIVDLHILRSHHFNAADRRLWTDPAAQERFLELWRQLSARLRHRPLEMLAYEPMNEPVADDPQDWNRVAARVVTTIREQEPQRTLIIGSNRWQSVDTFDELRVPAGDPNIILSFHFYTPMPLTHYKASWTKVGEFDGPVRYPGLVVAEEDLVGLSEELLDHIGRGSRYFDMDVLEGLMQKPLALAASTGLPLYCGEWGCLPSAPRTDRLRWYADMRSILERHGIAWANWDYKGSYGIVDPERRPDEGLIQTLLGDPGAQ